MIEQNFPVEEVDYKASDYIPPYVQDGFWPRIHMVRDLVASVRTVGVPLVDLGCNAGHLLDQVEKPCWGYDIASSPLRFGRVAGLDVRYADIMTDPLELAPIVAISEVLEHLVDPHGLIDKVNVDPVQYVVASSPFGEDEHDHYEQHCWGWDLEGFAAMFTDRGFTVIDHRTVGKHQAVLAKRAA